jgi:hypothetical protein
MKRELPDEGYIMFNVEEMRPACVILAAAYGATSEYHNAFPVESWIVQGDEVAGLKLYKIRRGQVEELVKRVTKLIR